AQEKEEDDTFQRRLVKLARMARLRPVEGKHYRPGHVADAAEQFAIDEVGEAAEEQAERHRGGDDVDHRPGRDGARAGEEDHRQDGAEKAAMERQATMPDGEDLKRVGGEARQVVEKHIADAAADDDADGRPKDEIVDIGGLEWWRRRRPEGGVGGE